MTYFWLAISACPSHMQLGYNNYNYKWILQQLLQLKLQAYNYRG